MDINTKYSTFKVQLHRLDTGTTTICKLKKKTFENLPLPIGAVINFRTETKPGWKKVDDKWEVDPTKTDIWLTSYSIDSYS